MRIAVGDRAEASTTITQEAVVAFSVLTGDTNPIHLDEEYAAKTKFGRRIAHGMLVSGVLSGVLGTKLPGPGAIYLSQSVKFRAPVYIGDVITAAVEVTKVRSDKPVVTLNTVCRNQRGELVVEGEAVLLIPD